MNDIETCSVPIDVQFENGVGEWDGDPSEPGGRLTIRCSSLPLITACPAAAIAPTVRIEPPRGPADMGTARA